AGQGTVGHRNIIWSGEYRFGREESFFPSLVELCRRFADKDPPRRPPDERFEQEVDALRAFAPPEGVALLDQAVYRWAHPDCPPSLYALTLTLVAPAGENLVAADGRLVRTLERTKVGKAKRTIAARIERYLWDVLGG